MQPAHNASIISSRAFMGDVFFIVDTSVAVFRPLNLNNPIFPRSRTNYRIKPALQQIDPHSCIPLTRTTVNRLAAALVRAYKNVIEINASCMFLFNLVFYYLLCEFGFSFLFHGRACANKSYW
jgi:hypothetical protein